MIITRGIRLRRITQILLSALLAITLAGCAGKTIRTNSTDGVAKQVFEWGFWSKRCQASDFTIKITQGPEFGIAEIGTGTMVIGRESASGARMACEGQSVATKIVNYTADKGFRGTDKIRLSVAGPFSAPRLFTLEIQVY